MTYKYKQKIVRMRYNTYRELRRWFPAMRNESLADYFERVARVLEMRKVANERV